MKSFRDGLIGPTVILFAICLVITAVLAFTYQQTEPVIELAEIKAADEVRVKVLPGSGSFSQVEGVDLPEGVFEVYKSDKGFVFKSGAKGFNGIVTYMIGMDLNGEVVGIEMFDHNETPGLGTKVAAEGYVAEYLGTANPDDVDTIAGVTKTTNSLKNALKQAKAAYEIVKGAA